MDGNGCKPVLTTGQVARLLGVATRTVSKWFDLGWLGGYRLPGGSRDRRIPRAALEAFASQHGLPLWEERGAGSEQQRAESREQLAAELAPREDPCQAMT